MYGEDPRDQPLSFFNLIYGEAEAPESPITCLGCETAHPRQVYASSLPECLHDPFGNMARYTS